MIQFFKNLFAKIKGAGKTSVPAGITPVPAGITPVPNVVPIAFVEPIKPPAKPERVYKIGISPGHGGEDPGALGAVTNEATLARRISDALLVAFKGNKAFDVTMYGRDEKKKNYTARVAASDARGDDYYIPVHLNATTNHKANGWLIFVAQNDWEKNLSLQNLCGDILVCLNAFEPLGFADWDYKKDGFMVGVGKKVYEESAPKAETIYLELGFISNPDWERNLLTDAAVKFMADQIVNGFEKFLEVERWRQ